MAKRLQEIIRCVLIIIPIIFFVFLFVKHFAPFGNLVINVDFKNESPFATRLRPDKRAGDFIDKTGGIIGQEIYGDPVYFDLKLPSNFKQARVKVIFQNEDEPIFRLGALANGKYRLYSFNTMENKIIDNLIGNGWRYIQEGENMLLQKNKTFNSIGEFLENLPAQDKVAVYDYKLDNNYKLLNYKKSTRFREINSPLKGAHIILTYIKDEALNWKFTLKQDKFLPQQQTEILVFNGSDKVVWQKTIIKDFSDIEEKIFIEGLPAGVYRIEVRGGEYLTISNITTLQSKFVFKNHLNLGDNKNLKFFMNIPVASFFTDLTDGLQLLSIDKDKFLINKTGERQQKIFSSYDVKEVYSPKGNIRVAGNGLFAFSRDQFFDPEFKSISAYFDAEKEGVEYIIARYMPPHKLNNGYKETVVDFDLSPLVILNDRVHFVFSAPNIAKASNAIKISAIEFKLTKDPWSLSQIWAKIKQYVKQ